MVCSLFILPISAKSEKVTDLNINDMIFLHRDDGIYYNVNSEWYFPVKSFWDSSSPFFEINNSFDRFLSVVLFNSSLDRSYITFDNVQTWRSLIILQEQLKNDYTFSDSASDFANRWVMYPSMDKEETTLFVGFSPKFVQQLNSYYESFCDSINVDSSLYPLNILSIDSNVDSWWILSDTMVYYFQSSGQSRTVHPDEVFLISYSDYQKSHTRNLSTFWSQLKGSIDIGAMTSWLPEKIGNQFIIYFGTFFALAGTLIVIKILHG